MARNKLKVEWVVVREVAHLFAGRRIGYLSLCGEAKHPIIRIPSVAELLTARKPVYAVQCVTCLREYRKIQQYPGGGGRPAAKSSTQH